jgi:glycosidase
MFDSTMNYIFRNAVLDYAGGAKAGDLVAQLELLRESYPPQAFHALMNLLSTHDQARSLHVLGWHDVTRDPALIERAKRRLLLAVFFQMTYPGSPAVYYGDEVGVTGGDDPYNRAPYPWADQGGQPDLALRAQFRRLIALRNDHAVLRRGALQAPLHVDDHVVVLLRRLGGRFAVVATNNAGEPRRVTVALPPGLRSAALADALGGAAVAVQADGRVSFEVPALFGRVLLGGAANEAAAQGGR